MSLAVLPLPFSSDGEVERNGEISTKGRYEVCIFIVILMRGGKPNLSSDLSYLANVRDNNIDRKA
jgi:hypothetical protein